MFELMWYNEDDGCRLGPWLWSHFDTRVLSDDTLVLHLKLHVNVSRNVIIVRSQITNVPSMSFSLASMIVVRNLSMTVQIASIFSCSSLFRCASSIHIPAHRFLPREKDLSCHSSTEHGRKFIDQVWFFFETADSFLECELTEQIVNMSNWIELL